VTPYVLADDLSGALETGAAFRAHGWRAVLPLRECEIPAGALRVLSSETRNRQADEAEAAVRAILTREKSAGASLLFKKIDSTLRGPIGAELAAVRAVLAPKRIVLCPANPIAGRTIRDGIVRIHGVPLLGTDFRTDPYWPAKSSSAADILRAQGVADLGFVGLKEIRAGTDTAAGAMMKAFESGAGVVVADAELQSDLGLIAQASRQAGADLASGSGGFAEAVAALSGKDAIATRPAFPVRFASMVVIAGSRSAMTDRQLKAAAKTGKLKIIEASPRDFDAKRLAATIRDELATRHVALVKFGAPAGTPASPADIIACVERAADVLAREVRPQIYFLTGGETAWTVCRALSGVSLEILAEAEPGVVFASLQREGGDPQFVFTKPGGFGRENLLARLLSVVK
jgi:D-threonate/D-erythronate kinase